MKNIKLKTALALLLPSPLFAQVPTYTITPTSTEIVFRASLGTQVSLPLGSIFLQYSKDSQKVQLINVFDRDNTLMASPDSLKHFYTGSLQLSTRARFDSFYSAALLPAAVTQYAPVASYHVKANTGVVTVLNYTTTCACSYVLNWRAYVTNLRLTSATLNYTDENGTSQSLHLGGWEINTDPDQATFTTGTFNTGDNVLGKSVYISTNSGSTISVTTVTAGGSPNYDLDIDLWK